MEKQRLVVNETSDKVDFLQSKLLTIEKHLPVMIQEILEYYFEKKIDDLMSKLVTKDEFKEQNITNTSSIDMNDLNKILMNTSMHKD